MGIRHFIGGAHLSIPTLPNKVKSGTTWELRFHSSLLYKHEVEDWDEDIHKAAGVKEKFFTPNYRAVMIGFRPDQETFSRMEVFPYFEIENKDHFSMPAPLTLDFISEWTESIYCNLTINSPIFTWKVYNSDKELVLEESYDMKTSATKLWEIDPWYGGQAKANCGMKLFNKKVKL